jgi:hypothetical protein
MFSRNALPLLIIFALCSGLWGCSSLSVHHLSPKVWNSDNPSRLSLKFWTIDYSCIRDGNRFEITGTALPVEDRFPTWSRWMSEMVITAYVCDPSGRVIAKKEFIQPPDFFPPSEGILFMLTLNTNKHIENPFITFGYRMVVLDERPFTDNDNPLKARNAQVFFASQEALRQ